MSIGSVNSIELIFGHWFHLLLWELARSIYYHFQLCISLILFILFLNSLGFSMFFIFRNYYIDCYFFIQHIWFLLLLFRLSDIHFISLDKVRIFLFGATTIIHLYTKIEISALLYFVLNLSIHKILLLFFLRILN